MAFSAVFCYSAVWLREGHTLGQCFPAAHDNTPPPAAADVHSGYDSVLRCNSAALEMNASAISVRALQNSNPYKTTIRNPGNKENSVCSKPELFPWKGFKLPWMFLFCFFTGPQNEEVGRNNQPGWHCSTV